VILLKFYAYQPVMTIHSALAMQCIQNFAKSTPYILAGDFNIKPDSGVYELYTTGKLKKNHPEHPPERNYDPWKVNLKEPVKSAYKEHNGEEPEFTNHASLNGNLFTGTLDYLFFSPQLAQVKMVQALPSISELGNPKALPNASEPSDHLLLAAEFVIQMNETTPTSTS
jgi:mRNA deadenylase 3'-5' endonuclease subunit Ccr4